jgi:hypothetical protein
MQNVIMLSVVAPFQWPIKRFIIDNIIIRKGFLVGNCDIDLFIFCYRFHIMRPKFLKFERGQNAAFFVQSKSNLLLNFLFLNKFQLQLFLVDTKDN